MNEEELKAVLEQHHTAGYGWALSCCRGNHAEAEDVLQTVYLKILEGRARYAGRAAFRTWFFAVIRNTAADERRKQALRRLRLLAAHERQAIEEPPMTPVQEAAPSPIPELVRTALTKLSPRQRQVLELVFSHDCTLQEASDIMGISIGSVRTHYERGKQTIRQWMTVQGVER